jgi:hypothetical protein
MGGLLVSACHTRPVVRGNGEPTAPWPDGDTLDIGLEGYPYPHEPGAHFAPELVNQAGVSPGIDVDHATVCLQRHVDYRRRVR